MPILPSTTNAPIKTTSPFPPYQCLDLTAGTYYLFLLALVLYLQYFTPFDTLLYISVAPKLGKKEQVYLRM